jgi:hypothetical protein
MRSGFPLRAPVLALLALLLFIAGCGTKGNAPALGKSGHASLTSPGSDVALASVALAPLGALRVTVYYRGKLIPTTGAQTPAELRENGCLGTLVAPISDGNPTLGAGTPGATGTPAAGAGTPLAEYAPDPAGGTDVAVAPGANLYVVVYSERNNPAAHIVACGDPLSGQNQYFDLYPPQVLGAGVALGTALMTPIDATRLSFTAGNTALRPTTWAVRSGSCTGAVLASGPVDSSSSSVSGVIYQALGRSKWWVELSGADGLTLCGEVVANG